MPLLPALFAGDINRFWWLVPLAFAVSLAYNASRYEMTEVIIHRAASFFWKTLAFMAGIFVVLYLMAMGL
ncbi:MAG: hypothetical protein WBC44_22540 [Planctomycetaceae bacterium]